MTTLEDKLRHYLQSIINRVGGSIEFWTVACLTRGELGNADEFVDTQWDHLVGDIQSLRSAVAELGDDPSPVIHEQVAKLMKLGNDLREVFDLLLRYTTTEAREIETAVLRLGFLWKEARLRTALVAALVPLPAPLPAISSDQEAYYQHILDDLFDRFTGTNSLGA